MQGSSYAEESPESLWKRNLQVTALSHAGDDEVVMSFVFRNGQIAAVASASGEEEIKQQTVEKSSRRQRGNSLCKSFPVTHGDSCDLCRSLYRSIEKDVEHAERPGCRTATVEIHRNVFCIVDSRKERFSLFKRCGEGRQTGCVFGNAGGIFQRRLLLAYRFCGQHTRAIPRRVRCAALLSAVHLYAPCGMQRNV